MNKILANKIFTVCSISCLALSLLNTTLFCNTNGTPESKIHISSEGQSALLDLMSGKKLDQAEQLEIKKLPFEDTIHFIVSSITHSPTYIIKRAEKIDEWADILLDARRFDSRILQHLSEYTDELLKTRLIKGATLFLRFDLFPCSAVIAKILENALSLPGYLFQAKYFSGKAFKGAAAVTLWLVSKVADEKSLEKAVEQEAESFEKTEQKTELPSSLEKKEFLRNLPVITPSLKQEVIERLKRYIIDQEKKFETPSEQKKFASFFSSFLSFGDALKNSFTLFFGDQPQSYVQRLKELERQNRSAENVRNIKNLLDEFCNELATLLISFTLYASFFDIFVPDESLSLSDALIAAFDFMNFKKAQIKALQKALQDFQQSALAASGSVFEPFVQDVYTKLVFLINKASTQIVSNTVKLGNDVLHALDQLHYEQPSEEKESSQSLKKKQEMIAHYKKLFKYTGMRGLSEYEKAVKDTIIKLDSTKAIFNLLVAEFDAIERGGFSTIIGNKLSFFDYSIQLLALEQLADFIYTERFGLSDFVYDKELTTMNLDYNAVENLKRAINQRIDGIREFVQTKPLINNSIDRELHLYKKIRQDKISALKAYLLLSNFAKKYQTPEKQFYAILSIIDLMRHYSLMSSDLVQSIRRVLAQKRLIEDPTVQSKPYFLWLRLKVATSDTEKDFLLQEEFARIRTIENHKKQKEQLALLAFFVKEQKNKNIYLEHSIDERIKQLAQIAPKPFGTTALGSRLHLEGKLPQDQGRILTDYISTILNKVGITERVDKKELEEVIEQLKEIKATFELYNLKKLYRDLLVFIEESIQIYTRALKKTEDACTRTTPKKSMLHSLFAGRKVELPPSFFTSITQSELKNYMQEYLQCSSDYLLKNAHSLQEWGSVLLESQKANSPIVEILKEYGDTIAKTNYFSYLISFLRFDTLPYTKDVALYLETLLWSPGALVAVRQIPGKAVYTLGNLIEWFAHKISNEKSKENANFQQDIFEASQKARSEVDESILASGTTVQNEDIIQAECTSVAQLVPQVVQADTREELEDIERIKDFIKTQQSELLLSLEESRYANFFKPYIEFSDAIKKLLQTKFFGPQEDSYLSKIVTLEAQSYDNEHIQELSQLYQKVVQEFNALVASFTLYISLFESFVPQTNLSLQESTVATFELINFKLTQADSLYKGISRIKEGAEFAQGSSLEFIAQDLIERLSTLVHEALIKTIAQKVEICKKYSNYLQNWAEELK